MRHQLHKPGSLTAAAAEMVVVLVSGSGGGASSMAMDAARRHEHHWRRRKLPLAAAAMPQIAPAISKRAKRGRAGSSMEFGCWLAGLHLHA
jgi:hypothetical protein